MVNTETATVTYKAITGLAPSSFSNVFTRNSDHNIGINLRNTVLDLYIPRMKTCKGQKVTSFRGPATWNPLPLDIKQANPLNSF